MVRRFSGTAYDDADDVIPLTDTAQPDDRSDDEDLDAEGVVATQPSTALSYSHHELPESGKAFQRTPGPSSSSLSTSSSSGSAGRHASRHAPHAGSSSNVSQTVAPSEIDDPWTYLQLRFARAWRRIPSSWSLERDPAIAFRHVMTLFGFLSLCIFVFSVPYLLFLISPRAPTPPGTSPPLDEAASTVTGKQGAVAADVPKCSEVGVHVLKDLSGNAIDAAIASVLCQGVLAPFASGLGGGAIILVHFKKFPSDLGISRMYDATEMAPAAATFDIYASKNISFAQQGGLAVAVPGELRGLYRMHTDFGKLPWKDVVMPVIEVAQSAKVGQFLATTLKRMNDTILQSPSLTKLFTKKVLTTKGQNQQDAAAAAELPGVRRQLFHSDTHDSLYDSADETHAAAGSHESAEAQADNDKNKQKEGTSNGKGTSAGGLGTSGLNNDNDNETHVIEVLKEGDVLKNEALVHTLRSIALHGPDALYHNLSETIASEIRDAGGVMTGRDLRGYTVKVRDVVESVYQGFTILGASPPSSGGASIAMALNMITHLEFRKKGRNAVTFRLLAECMKWVFGAAMGLADPSYVSTSHWQLHSMLSRREALRRAFRIDPDRTFPPSRYAPGISTSKLQSGTSHVSVVDANGTAVSISSSINLSFGSQLLSAATGFIYNDAMHAFTTDATRPSAFGLYPTSENAVEPGKRPASAACPTIVLRGRQVYLTLGGSGGPKAITGVLQTLLNILDFGDPLADAISAPRIHHQLIPNVLQLEAANGSTCSITDSLKRPSDSSPSSQTHHGWAYWSSVCESLKLAGHQLDAPEIHTAVQAVLVPSALSDDIQGDLPEEEDGRTIYAASDHRRIGKAAAY